MAASESAQVVRPPDRTTPPAAPLTPTPAVGVADRLVADRADALTAPAVSLPQGGGSMRGIGEKFTANPATGTGTLTIPLPASPGRPGVRPELSLAYDSGSGNGVFGLGWALSLPAITRKTDKGCRATTTRRLDVFLLSGAEDLVPVLDPDGAVAQHPGTGRRGLHRDHRYRPRIEGRFARIERWTRGRDGDVHWRSLSRDNVTDVYGEDARVADRRSGRPDGRVFSWLLCESARRPGQRGRLPGTSPRTRRASTRPQAHERNRGPTPAGRRTAT